LGAKKIPRFSKGVLVRGLRILKKAVKMMKMRYSSKRAKRYSKKRGYGS